MRALPAAFLMAFCCQSLFADAVPSTWAKLIPEGQVLVSAETWDELLPVHREMLQRVQLNRDAGLLPLEGPMACFTEGYSPKAVADFQRAVWGVEPGKDVRIGSRWTTTATNGGVSRGQPITLTYSFVTDGLSLPGSAGEPVSASRLFAFFETDCGYTRAQWQQRFRDIFDRWEALSGLTFQLVSDDGAAFPGSSGALGARGDIRIGAHFIDGQSGSNTLAYNFFPNTGDMVIDSGNPVFFSDRSNNSLGLRNVLAHEGGHGLGFNHVCPVNQTKLMEPIISTAYDGPQDDDIQAVQRNYGDGLENDDTAPTATIVGAIGAGFTVSNVSIDGSGDPDWFSFTLSTAGRLTATLAPVGSSYLEGVQNGDGSCSAGTTFDSRRNANLSMELRNADGTSILNRANSAGLGANEVLSNVSLVGPATYTLRIVPGSEDVQQRYSLTVAFTETVVTQTDLSVTKTDGAFNVSPGDTVTYTIVARNTGVSANGSRLLDTLPGILTNATWTAVYAGGASGPTSGTGNLNVTITTFPNNGTGTFTVVAQIPTNVAGGTLANTAQILTPTGIADSNASNNEATDTNQIVSALPADLEDFILFAGMTGSATFSLNDTDTGFTRSAAFTGTGFPVDLALSQNGRGLTFNGIESRSIANAVDLGGPYLQSSWMMAFWLRMDSVTSQSNGAWTQVLTARSRSSTLWNYILSVGKDTSGNARARMTIPNNTLNNVSVIDVGPTLPTLTWIRVVIQYSNASDATSAPTTPARLRLWINPVSGSDAATFDTNGSGVIVTSQFGAGPLGRYAFGRTFDNSGVGTGGGQVWVDAMGTWDGFGTAGVNNLQAAIDHLALAAPPAGLTVTDQTTGLVIANGSTTPIDLGFTPRGSTALTRSFSLTNPEAGTLFSTTPTAPAGFTFSNTISFSVPPGLTDTFTLTLPSGTAGVFAGNVSFNHNGPGANPFQFQIRGVVGLSQGWMLY